MSLLYCTAIDMTHGLVENEAVPGDINNNMDEYASDEFADIMDEDLLKHRFNYSIIRSQEQTCESNAAFLLSKRDALIEKIQQSFKKIKKKCMERNVCTKKTISTEFSPEFNGTDNVSLSSFENRVPFIDNRLPGVGLLEDRAMNRIESDDHETRKIEESSVNEVNSYLSSFIDFSISAGQWWWSFLVWLEINKIMEVLLAEFQRHSGVFIKFLWRMSVNCCFLIKSKIDEHQNAKKEETITSTDTKLVKSGEKNSLAHYIKRTSFILWHITIDFRKFLVVFVFLIVDLIYQFILVNLHIFLCIAHSILKLMCDIFITWLFLPFATAIICFFNFEKKTQDFIFLRLVWFIHDSTIAVETVIKYFTYGIISLTKIKQHSQRLTSAVSQVIRGFVDARKIFESFVSLVNDIYDVLVFLYFLLECVTNTIYTLTVVIACTGYYLYYVAHAFQVLLYVLTSLSDFVQIVAGYLQKTPRKRVL